MSKTNILLTSLMTHNFSRRKFHTPRQSNYSFFTIYGLDNIPQNTKPHRDLRRHQADHQRRD